MIITGLTFPGSVPIVGFRSAIQISNCLAFIVDQFKFVKNLHGIVFYKL